MDGNSPAYPRDTNTKIYIHYNIKVLPNIIVRKKYIYYANKMNLASNWKFTQWSNKPHEIIKRGFHEIVLRIQSLS